MKEKLVACLTLLVVMVTVMVAVFVFTPTPAVACPYECTTMPCWQSASTGWLSDAHGSGLTATHNPKCTDFEYQQLYWACYQYNCPRITAPGGNPACPFNENAAGLLFTFDPKDENMIVVFTAQTEKESDEILYYIQSDGLDKAAEKYNLADKFEVKDYKEHRAQLKDKYGI